MRKPAPDIKKVLSLLKSRYGDSPHTQLKHRNNTDLFVAVLLSPQCTDKQTNAVTERLFKKYRTFGDYANADIKRLSADLSGLNYYKTKARNLKASAQMIESRFGGKVPRSMDELMELPGVGRKVANVMLNEGFGIYKGIAVDTHCAVVSRRLGYSRHRDPKKIEQDLLRKIPEKEWGVVSNLFIELGRDTCKAARKECKRCVLKDICPSSSVS
ncbi:MAG: endonuclease III [Candidatus Marsarchaeota archaeon]|nr:endonuclease III [Candidatus Marsarchaeota archaeon]